MSSSHFKYLKELDEFRNEIKDSLLKAFKIKLKPLDCDVFITVWRAYDTWNYIAHIRIQQSNGKIVEKDFFIDPTIDKEDLLKDQLMQCCKALISEILSSNCIEKLERFRFSR